jgi:arabinan endo-1,5-alpha-L-arabinosidase
MPTLKDLENEDKYNPSANAARELLELDHETGKNAAVNAGIDQAESFANNPKNASANIQDVSNRENGYWTGTGSKPKTKRNWGKILKRAAPLGIGGLVFGGAGLGLFFFSPGLLLVQMKEVFTNYNSDASRSDPLRYNKLMAYTLGNKKVDKACAKNPGGTKCRLGTFSEKQKGDYEKAGFKVAADKVGDRYRITQMQFPDEPDGKGGTKPGKVVKTGNAFVRETRTNVRAGSAATKAFNAVTKVLTGARSSTKVLSKFGADKTKVEFTGDTDDEKKNDFNTKIGGDDTKEKIQADYESKNSEKLKAAGKIGFFAKITGPAAAGCITYNIARAGLATSKLFNGLRYVTFALMFLKVADQIKDGGDVDPGTVAALGTILTGYAVSGPERGLSATDSQGYKIAAYGGESKLQKFTQSMLLGGNSNLIALDNTIKWVNNEVGGKKNIRYFCRGINDPKLAAALGLAMCAGETGAGAAAGTIVPVAGNVAGAIAGVASCAIEEALILTATSAVVSGIIKFIMPYIIKSLVDAPISSKISGVDAGNAMALGTSVLLGTSSMSRGLRPGTSGQITHFLASTSDVEKQSEQIAAYDAKSEPLNIYNQYSFLGSLVRKSGLATMNTSTFGSALSSLGSFFSSSLSGANLAYADTSMPVNITANDLKDCQSAELNEIGVACDKMNQPKFVMTDNALNMNIDDNLDYMVNKKQVDEDTGDPISGSKYEKWVKYCSDNREDLMGSSSLPIEDDDYEWSTGQNCGSKANDVSQTEIDNFNVYYNTLALKEDADTETAVQTTNTDPLDFTVGSYNMCHEVIHDSGFDACPSIPTKQDKEAKVIQGISTIGNPAMDVIATQETSQPTQKAVMSALGSAYDSWPKTVPENNGKAIIWNTNKFSLDGSASSAGFLTSDTTINGIKYPIHGNGDSESKDNNSFPWVHLKTAGGLSMYVMSIHSPNDKNGGAKDRYDNAVAFKAWAKERSSDGSLVIIAGDFNSGGKTDGGNPGAYCYLTSDGAMAHAKDLAANPNNTQNCPGGSVPIDQILTSTDIAGMTASGWNHVDDGGAVSGTDHSPGYVTYHLPGSTSQTASTGGGSPTSYQNPVYNGAAPDPSVIKADDGTYHVYATGGSNDNPFVHLTSTDLVKWKPAGRTLNNAPAWVKSGLHWAPDVAKVGNVYILTFTSGTSSSRKIGYAVGSSAAGPFNYKGVLVESGEFGQPDSLGTIDSHIFVDGATPYLFFGGGVISSVRITVTPDGTITKDNASRKILIQRNSSATVEGAFVYKHGNYYYLYYSYGDYEARSGGTEYSTRIARATSVMGPYEPASPYKALITGQDPFRAPGHNSVITDGQGHDWIIYHSLVPRSGSRVLMLDPIRYENDWPVVNDGHPSSGSGEATL